MRKWFEAYGPVNSVKVGAKLGGKAGRNSPCPPATACLLARGVALVVQTRALRVVCKLPL